MSGSKPSSFRFRPRPAFRECDRVTFDSYSKGLHHRALATASRLVPGRRGAADSLDQPAARARRTKITVIDGSLLAFRRVIPATFVRNTDAGREIVMMRCACLLRVKSAVSRPADHFRPSLTSRRSLGHLELRIRAGFGSIGLRFLTPLAALRGIIFLRAQPSSVCFGENCDASET
jgi:hypothetical protein